MQVTVTGTISYALDLVTSENGNQRLRIPMAFDHFDDDGKRTGSTFHDITLFGDTCQAAHEELGVGDVLELKLRIVNRKVQNGEDTRYYTNFIADEIKLVRKAAKKAKVDLTPKEEPVKAKSRKRA